MLRQARGEVAKNECPMCEEKSGHSDVPIIIATGRRLDESDHAVSLELGADYYIVKPLV
jgi:two-component system OmpR family response regulator